MRLYTRPETKADSSTKPSAAETNPKGWPSGSVSRVGKWVTVISTSMSPRSASISQRRFIGCIDCMNRLAGSGGPGHVAGLHRRELPCKSATLRPDKNRQREGPSLNRLLSTLTLTAGVLSALMALPAHALQITSLTPQGEVARVRQIVAKFDQPAVKFGDPKAPAPLAVSCTDAAAGKGTGRWTG